MSAVYTVANTFAEAFGPHTFFGAPYALATAVANPAEFTVATEVLLLDHVGLAVVTVCPAAFLATAVYSEVAPIVERV